MYIYIYIYNIYIYIYIYIYIFKFKATKLRNVYILKEKRIFATNISISSRKLLQCILIKYFTKRHTHSNN